MYQIEFFPMLVIPQVTALTANHPPPANSTCNALKLSSPCEYFVGVGEHLLGNAVFVFQVVRKM